MNTINEFKNTESKPVVVADNQGIIIFVNKCFEKVFYWSYDEIIGQPITTIIPKNYHDAHHLGFSRYQNTEKSSILEHPLKLKAIRKDGVIFSAIHFICAEKIADAWMFAAYIEPVEEHMDS